MPTLYELIQSEYKTEYISEYTKLKELMEKKNSWDNTKQKVLYNLNFVKIREIRGGFSPIQPHNPCNQWET